MKIFNGLPIYEGFVNDDEAGMFCISLVDMPATETDFLYFSKDEEPLCFAIQDEEKHLVRGLLMGAGQMIYRRKGDYEFYITYSAETLRLMAEKYLKNGFSSNVDLNHDGVPVEGINMTQIFVKDVANGIDPKGFEAYNDGSLFVEFKVNNEEVWEQIKNGNFKGFSLAGIFEVREAFNKQENKIKTNPIMKIEKIKAALRKILAEFGSISTNKGVIVWEGDEEIREGDSVHGLDEEGNDIALEDGEYETEDKRVITLENGVVAKIEDLEEISVDEPQAEEEAPAEETEPMEEEKPEEEPKAEETEEEDKDERIANLEAEIARLEQENGELKERIKELEAEPAAEPADEEFKKIENKVSKREQDMMKRGYKF